MKIEEKIKNLVEKTIIDNHYELCDVQYLKEGSMMFLRITIDKIGGIGVEDCAKVSNLINPILDEADPIEENYILDVCSKEGVE
jgi:ribosome maturation factor RimP